MNMLMDSYDNSYGFLRTFLWIPMNANGHAVGKTLQHLNGILLKFQWLIIPISSTRPSKKQITMSMDSWDYSNERSYECGFLLRCFWLPLGFLT